MSVTEFLLARIAEDEIIARRGLDVPHETGPSEENDDAGPCPDHCVGHYSGRRHLAECRAKRAIIEQAQEASSDRWTVINDRCITSEEREQEAATDPGVLILRHLAAVYADHPDYRQEWRP